jgi:hypothetical protein
MCRQDRSRSALYAGVEEGRIPNTFGEIVDPLGRPGIAEPKKEVEQRRHLLQFCRGHIVSRILNGQLRERWEPATLPNPQLQPGFSKCVKCLRVYSSLMI